MENTQILQMIPLKDNKLLFLDDSIIALALVQTANGKQQLAYIEHDRVTGQPTLRVELKTHHQ